MPTDRSDPDHRRQLRKTFRHKRLSLDPTIRAEASRLINTSLHNLMADMVLQQRTARLNVAAYLAADGEVALTDWLQDTTHSVYLPRISPDGNNTMGFYAWDRSAVLETNRFGISEPAATAAQITPDNLDLVLMPLVAFDSRGGRLGMGGGYYDRYFAGSRVPRIGIAFQCQQSAALLPAADWDVPLTAVVTERGMLECHPP